jgi:uncharacterized membrane protein YbjE (DUF340 family)
MIYYLIFFLGLLSGALIRRPRLFEVAHKLIVGCGYLLITLFGYQMASAFSCGDSRVADVASAGVLAVCAAAGSVAFSFLFLWAVYKFNTFPHETHENHEKFFDRIDRILRIKTQSNNPINPVNPVKNLLCASARYLPVTISLSLLLVGIVVGVVAPAVPVESPIKLFLLLMIVAVGFQSAQEIRTLKSTRGSAVSTTSALVVLLGLPVAVIMGTLCSCAIAGLFLTYGWRDSMLCGAPMGWQTLGGPMIQELRGLQLGNVAFLTNMFRDVVSLVMIPLVSRRGYALLGVTPGGVSSMDILLPGIMAASGRHVLLYAMWVGASCSFWAPILIYLIAKGIS